MSEYTITKSGSQWAVLDPSMETVAKFKTKREASEHLDTIQAEPKLEKHGTGWLLVNGHGDILGRFRSRKTAEEALAAHVGTDTADDTPQTDTEPESDSSDAPEGDVAPVEPVDLSGVKVVTLEQIESMDRTARYLAAKDEWAALKSWKESGGEGDRPSTPILDYFADPASAETRKNGHTRKPSGERRTRSPKVELPEAAEKKAVDIITKCRADGLAWKAIAAKFNDRKVNDSTEWVGPQVYSLAVRKQLPVFGKDRNEVKA